MYIGIENKRQAICMPPSAMKTVFAPSCSNQRLKKRENTRPWKTSVAGLVSATNEQAQKRT
ncbi:hypothetical protein LTR28_010129, partial [Elasticomyces elasticus]